MAVLVLFSAFLLAAAADIRAVLDTQMEDWNRGLWVSDGTAGGTHAILDLTAGYQIPNTRGTLQLVVNNVFDGDHRSFAGVPAVGRFAMVKVRYDLF